MELSEKFKYEVELVNGVCYIFSDIKEIIQVITNEIITSKHKKIIINTSMSLTQLVYNELIKNGNINVKTTQELYSQNLNLKEEFQDADIGVSCANFLVADTGTVVLKSSLYEPQMLSLLPPVSIIIGEKDNLVPDLDTFLSNFNEDCNITLITGPSRTADIEKILVTGVHGPKKLIVIIFDEKA